VAINKIKHFQDTIMPYEMKAHLLDRHCRYRFFQTKIDAIRPNKMNDHPFGIVPSSLPTLLASKLRAL
jgi:hypothetical protein